jgi:hypothetical protein
MTDLFKGISMKKWPKFTRFQKRKEKEKEKNKQKKPPYC